MSKKKLYILPIIVLVIVSIMSITVLGATDSPELNLFKVWDKKGNNITDKFIGEEAAPDGFDLSKVQGINDEIHKVDKKLNAEDFDFVAGVDINKKLETPGNRPWKVELSAYKVRKGYVGLIVHVVGDGTYDKHAFRGKGEAGYIDGIQGVSPFYLYIAKAKSSAQTGDFVPAYIAMIAVALMSCGAIFAIRAKKASK